LFFITPKYARSGQLGLYDRIPIEVRRYLETQRLRSSMADGRHQVFGIGLNVQGQIEKRAEDVLLFQADSDEMLMWTWGDVGVIQFWITTDNLIAQNWDAIEATFEGG